MKSAVENLKEKKKKPSEEKYLQKLLKMSLHFLKAFFCENMVDPGPHGPLADMSEKNATFFLRASLY